MKTLLILSLCLWTMVAYSAPKNAAVVIIDMQKGFYDINKVAKSKEVSALVQKQVELITWASTNKVPVIVFEFLGMGATDSRIIAALKNHPHQIITKEMDDGFSAMRGDSQKLAVDALKKWGVKNLIVSGINGSSCVTDTIQGAGVLGFMNHTSADLVGDLMTSPATYPDETWFFSYPKLKIYKSVQDILK